MLKVYNCIIGAHDLSLVALAAVVCALSSFAAVSLLRHARTAGVRMRRAWLAVAAIAIGFGIWATHFIAMLAFSPGVPSGYNISLTALSLVAAILLTGTGFAASIESSSRIAPWFGGAVVAGGIAAMHYTGMAAFDVAGIIIWDRTLVAASIILGAALGAVALPTGLHGDDAKWKIGGAVLLTLAICSHHFTAMGAVSIIPDPLITVPQSAIPPVYLALAVGVASFVILLLTFAGLALDVRERRRHEAEADRMRGLANAAVEGLLVSSEGTIVTVNDSFAKMADWQAHRLTGRPLSDCFPDGAVLTRLSAALNKPIESTLRRKDGGTVPVELIMRKIDFAGTMNDVFAVRDLSARKRNEQHIRFLAHHDSLTGLPNRAQFNEQLEQAIKGADAVKGKRLAVLCLDLDRFKEVNDLFGHAAGDSVLRAVASRVSDVLDDGQMLARLGGDEFAILMRDVGNPAAAGDLADRVLAALRSKDGDDQHDRISSSVGIAVYPDDAADSETLLNYADTALYRAKSDGRDMYCFFEAKMGAEVRERRMLEHDLRHAVPRGELHLAYQPQQHVVTGAVTGFEALLRWRHPVRGDVSPGVFIPIAEESGSIMEIGTWVLEEACREAATWSAPLVIAVNVSTIQLYNPNFVQELHEILLRTGLPPSRLEIEITETALVRDFNRALMTLRRVKALGIQIAMDDFGTGYSSLSNLRAFPFDKIKIDGSFIKAVDHNAQAATIVRAVLGLGRGLALPVLAEGVETVKELEFLRSESCDQVQGYYVGRPAAIGKFRDITSGLTTDLPADLDLKARQSA